MCRARSGMRNEAGEKGSATLRIRTLLPSRCRESVGIPTRPDFSSNSNLIASKADSGSFISLPRITSDSDPCDAGTPSHRLGMSLPTKSNRQLRWPDRRPSQCGRSHRCYDLHAIPEADSHSVHDLGNPLVVCRHSDGLLPQWNTPPRRKGVPHAMKRGQHNTAVKPFDAIPVVIACKRIESAALRGLGAPLCWLQFSLNDLTQVVEKLERLFMTLRACDN